MKMSVNSSIILFIVFLFSLTNHSIRAQENEDVFVISGIVKSQKNKRPLEYVNVSVPGSNVGTITNSDGAFTLKVKKSLHAHLIEISHIGYETATIHVNQKDVDDRVIYITPNTVVLNEVVVKPVDARKIVEQALVRIPENYNDKSAMYTGFYRETSQKRKKYISICEAVINVYKSAYTEDISKDRVKVFKGRRLLSPHEGDTLAIKLLGGPTQAIFIDMVKNPDVLLSKDCLMYYNYTFNDYVNIDNRPHYAIRFEPRMMLDEPLYQGTLYIDRETQAITRMEFALDMRDKIKATSLILRSKPVGLRFKPENLSYLVTYRQMGGRTYLNYVRTEIKFKCDWKRKLFSTGYTVISEMVMTDRLDNAASTITYRESFKANQVLSEKVLNFYDENFWESYNIIEPTESLENAVNKLKKSYE
ncbi:MAG: carboxypeptidase-like regulatory domain-containing protein [Bacteroides graminisolvens]|nr:carboxypeptidase-like regulatory domain-containing protein [Bacteroides graminisolvens]